MGAPDPRTEDSPRPLSSYDWEKAKQHWSFRPVQDPPVPRVASAEWRSSPIDAFIKAKLDSEKLAPQPRAAKLALIRRVTYDLIGLPPTPEEVDAFLKDARRRFEKVVDRLLASPAVRREVGPALARRGPLRRHRRRQRRLPGPAMRIDIATGSSPPSTATSPTTSSCASSSPATSSPTANDIEDYQQKVVATGYLANSRRFGSRAPIDEFHLTIDDTIDNLGKGDPRPDRRLRPLPRSQVRPHPDRRLLRPLRHLPQHRLPAPRHRDLPAHLRLRGAESGAVRGAEEVGAGPRRPRHPHRGHQGRPHQVRHSPRSVARPSRRNATASAQLHAEYPYLRKAYAVSEGKPADARIMVRGRADDARSDRPARLPRRSSAARSCRADETAADAANWPSGSPIRRIR